jgi:hypothetical protein
MSLYVQYWLIKIEINGYIDKENTLNISVS